MLKGRIDLRRLLHRQIHLLEIDAQQPRGDLRPGPTGEANWKFDFAPKGDSGTPVEIGSVSITDGNITFFDPQFKTDVALAVHTEPASDGNDARLVASWPAYEDALKKAGIRYQGYVYPGVEHGFNNDTTPRFDKAAADLAWGRTIALFRRTLA